MKGRLITLVAIVFSLMSIPAAAKDARTLVLEGNRAFGDGDYQTALAGYNEAEVLLPEAPELSYNKGVAHYKLNELDKARDAFQRALLTRDPALEADIKYNLGNVAHGQALEKLSSLQEAIDLLKQSIGHYRDALELDPEDEDAKTNINMAQLLIKDLLDKLKKQQEQQQNQQQDQDCDNPQNQDQQNQDQQQQNQQNQNQQQDQQQQEQSEQSQSQQQQQQEPSEQKDEQNQDGQLGSDQEQQPEEQQQRQASEAREMTPEEAARLLQSVRDKERKRRDELAKRRRANRRPVLKDW